MIMRNSVLFLLASVLLTGCTLNLHSLFTSKDVTYEPSLVGNWQNEETTWLIKAYDKPTGRYLLQTTIKDQPQAEFSATLGMIGTNRFLELTPKRPNEIHPKTFYGGHFVQLHSIWKVGLNGDNLTLTSLSMQWLETAIKQNKVNLKCEKPEGGVLFLTASTPELQEFVSKYADDPGAFPSRGDEKGIMFERSKETPKVETVPQAGTMPWSPPKDWEKTTAPVNP